jgi:hypothetical protein
MAQHRDQATCHARRGALIILLTGFGWLMAADRANAQYGFGGGWWGLGYQTPASVNYLNQRSLAAGQAAYASRPQPLREPARPTRDVTFFERYDAETRAQMEEGIARRSSRPRSLGTTTPTPAPAPQPHPNLPLGTFFNSAGKLVWPSDAPTSGDLLTKRNESDDATMKVYRELFARGAADIPTASNARTKLLDYGRPALEYMRKNSTSRVADTFHLFLLSLYDSIGQAVDPPKTAAKPAS